MTARRLGSREGAGAATRHSIPPAAAAGLRRFVRAWAVLASALLCLLAAPGAFAHASLVGADPADASVLDAMPARMALAFNEPVRPLVFSLLAPDGTTVPLPDVRQHDEVVLAALPPDGRHGTFALSWRVVSEDGHPVGGALTFSVGAPSGAAGGAGQGGEPRSALLWLVRAGLFAGLFVGIGGALFLAFAPDSEASRRVPAGALLASAAALPAAAALQGLDALDAPLSRWAQPDVWQAAFATTYGATMAWWALAVAAALASLAVRRRRGRRPIAAAAVLALACGLAASGHAGSAPPAWLARPAIWLHGLAIACWIGALLPLRQALARGRGGRSGLRWFSRRILPVVVVLAASGTLLACLQLGGAEALWQTAYGRVLLAKLALLAMLFGVALRNRRSTAHALDGDTRASGAIAFAIGIEITLVLAVFAVAALWRFTPPPRALAQSAAAAQASLHIHTETAMADVTLHPAVGGRPASLDIFLSDGSFVPLAAQEVSVEFANAEAGIEPLRRSARPDGLGRWRIADLDLPALSRWTVRIDALVSDFDRLQLDGQLDLARHDSAGTPSSSTQP